MHFHDQSLECNGFLLSRSSFTGLRHVPSYPRYYNLHTSFEHCREAELLIQMTRKLSWHRILRLRGRHVKAGDTVLARRSSVSVIRYNRCSWKPKTDQAGFITQRQHEARLCTSKLCRSSSKCSRANPSYNLSAQFPDGSKHSIAT